MLDFSFATSTERRKVRSITAAEEFCSALRVPSANRGLFALKDRLEFGAGGNDGCKKGGEKGIGRPAGCRIQ
jgi:hypothetical protein